MRVKELRKIRKTLEKTLQSIPGILFEDKGPILTVHYRNSPPEYSVQVQKVVKEVLERWKDGWQIAWGEKILEIWPRMDFNKGKAVQELIGRMPSPGLLPIYLGDDWSDEDAFQTLQGKGISIFVGLGSTPSAANYFLRDPSEVGEFLERCVETLRS